jgi:signal transduction histidine kinase
LVGRRSFVIGALSCVACSFGCADGPGAIERAGGTTPASIALRLGADTEPTARVDPGAFAPSVAWREVPIPDFWPLARRVRNPAAWYRAEIELPAELDDWVVAIGGRWGELGVYWNGERVAMSHWTERLHPSHLTAEGHVVLPLPRERKQPGRNQLLLHFEPLPEEIASLSWLAAGPRAAVMAERNRARLANEEIPAALMLLGIATGALVIGLARYSDKPGVAWLGAGVILWCVASLGGPLAARPASAAGWLYSVLAHAFVPVSAVGLARMVGRRWGRGDALLAATVAVGATLRATAPPILIPATDNLWWLANLGITAWYFPVGVQAARAGLLPAPRLLLAGAVVVVLAAAHDFASLAAGRVLLPVGSFVQRLHPVIVVVAATALVIEIARAMREARALNRELEQRVEEKRRELAASWARTAELERDRAIAAERERMMRDMHDGTGGQLVSALALVEGGDFRQDDLAETLRSALADLRLAIDSLDAGEADLLALLAQARARLEPRLEPHGVRFAWEVEDVPTPAHFGPEQTLHVLRVFQEAVTNVLKHARAKTITIRTGTALHEDEPVVWIEIADDGIGFPSDDTTPRDGGGRGLRNMRRRAAELGGTLAVSSGTHGTRIRLRVPLAPG